VGKDGREIVPDDAPIWYFGYGSNMCRATFLGRRGMRPLETRTGRLDGYRLCFDLPVGPGERGVANVVADTGAHTWGVLYLLEPGELDRLDRTEGVHRGFYERLPISVICTGDTCVAAVTYRSPHGRAGRKPSARYLGLLLDGAREQALPDTWVDLLRAFELAVDEREGGGAA
jgi:cation transport regulator ChaC